MRYLAVTKFGKGFPPIRRIRTCVAIVIFLFVKAMWCDNDNRGGQLAKASILQKPIKPQPFFDKTKEALLHPN